MSNITRRTALTGATAAVAAVGVPTLVTAQDSDAELIALGQQWQEAYGEWIRACDLVSVAFDSGEPDCRLLKLEKATDPFFDRQWRLRDRIGEIPARSINGALVKLRIVVAQGWVMGENDDTYGRLTYQAWQSLETESGAAAFERLAEGLPS